MSEKRQVEPRREVTLFVCSGCETCDPALSRFQEWAANRPDVMLEIALVLREPERIVRLRISCAPAVVVDGELLAQNASAEVLIALVEAYLNGSKQISGGN